MSVKSDDIQAKISNILAEPWVIEDGRVVPKTEDVNQKNGGKRLEATYLYADLADSTLLAKRFVPEFTARVVRMYLRGAVDAIRHKGGHIRSFDGDRVMGIFIGDRRRNNALEAALHINWAVDQVINPQLTERLKTSTASWQVSHRVGIDDGETLIVRGGARDNSDLVSIGRAPNIAAKLSSIRGESGAITVTDRVHSFLLDKNKVHEGRAMWGSSTSRTLGPHAVTTYSSAWWRRP
ncbi:adenylate cyclase [Arthrobacter sp. V1I9]|uniref:adenylate/guanylate cyclase domain-containing protein n=1 Tax=Arthrobacter sp. V1I9 TaxID=3042275 RepID=UPI00278FC53F|nr:adenylate/guanylate cyclase domain-containing protein [Arthrobacter sp. V1I9]MDQ0869026.1 adenylate cyclase [Arthrobacter sp. V1I9]